MAVNAALAAAAQFGPHVMTAAIVTTACTTGFFNSFLTVRPIHLMKYPLGSVNDSGLLFT